MLHLIEDGIEDNVLRAGLDDLLNFFGAFGAASPD
jgi:hypothetical protein